MMFSSDDARIGRTGAHRTAGCVQHAAGKGSTVDVQHDDEHDADVMHTAGVQGYDGCVQHAVETLRRRWITPSRQGVAVMHDDEPEDAVDHDAPKVPPYTNAAQGRSLPIGGSRI
jgi:hypothetical protein